MSKKLNGKKGLDDAVEKMGGTGKLAKALGISSQAISQWKKWRRVPAEHVIAIERLTGIHRHYLNPQIYPEPPSLQVPSQTTDTVAA